VEIVKSWILNFNFMKTLDNYHIVLTVFFSIIFSSSIHSQTRSNGFLQNNSIPDDSAFLDASSNAAWNNSSAKGKGLLFPETDLTTLNRLVTRNAISPANKPNYYNGLIVFNTATGQSSIGDVSVEPGFYYYSNPDQNFPNGDAQAGTWKPLGSAGSPKIHITENTPTETNLVTANTATEKVISITGTADGITTHIDLGTTVLPKDTVINFRKAIICDNTGNQVLVATGSYDSATNKFVTGNGMMNYCLPAANDYKVELYFTSN
jgi:hypothetical protein